MTFCVELQLPFVLARRLLCKINISTTNTVLLVNTVARISRAGLKISSIVYFPTPPPPSNERAYPGVTELNTFATSWLPRSLLPTVAPWGFGRQYHALNDKVNSLPVHRRVTSAVAMQEQKHLSIHISGRGYTCITGSRRHIGTYFRRWNVRPRATLVWRGFCLVVVGLAITEETW